MSNTISKLRKENLKLKEEISNLKASIAGARCYLIFWDHGKYETKNSLLDNIDMARDILDKGVPDSTYILKLYEGWMKNKSSEIKYHNSKLPKENKDILFDSCKFSEYFGDYSMRLCNHPNNKNNHLRPNCGFCGLHSLG